jgi:hypothetical protein
MRQFGIKEGILLAFASRIILDPTMEAKGGNAETFGGGGTCKRKVHLGYPLMVNLPSLTRRKPGGGRPGSGPSGAHQEPALQRLGVWSKIPKGLGVGRCPMRSLQKRRYLR